MVYFDSDITVELVYYSRKIEQNFVLKITFVVLKNITALFQLSR